MMRYSEHVRADASMPGSIASCPLHTWARERRSEKRARLPRQPRWHSRSREASSLHVSSCICGTDLKLQSVSTAP